MLVKPMFANQEERYFYEHYYLSWIRLGKGGQGEVKVGFDHETGAMVAVKVNRIAPAS